MCWLPAFFTDTTQSQLGDLVVLEHVLDVERFDQYAGHLSAVDRQSAKGQLENQRRQLRQSIRHAINQAYGISAADPAVIDDSHPPASRFPTLMSNLVVAPPVETDLASAFEALVDQMLSRSYPAHPAFGREIKRNDLKKVQVEVRRLFDDPNDRIVPEQGLRPLLREVATPLRLGQQGEQGFVRDDYWLHRFVRLIESHQDGPVTVGHLRASFDEPAKMGLTTDVGDLVILSVCDEMGYGFTRYGGPYPGEIGNLANDLELHLQQLPDTDDWVEAIRRAGVIFGISAGARTLTPGNVADFASQVLNVASEYQPHPEALVAALETRAARYDVDGEAKRLRTAAAAAALVEQLTNARPGDVPAVLARADIATTEQAVRRSLTTARQVCELVDEENWRVIDHAVELDTTGELRQSLATLFAADEFEAPFESGIKAIRERATDLAFPRPTVPPNSPTTGSGEASHASQEAPTVPVDDVEELEVTLDTLDDLRDKLAQALADAPGGRLRVSWMAAE